MQAIARGTYMRPEKDLTVGRYLGDFSIISRRALRRGSFTTVVDLIAAIERLIAAWNDRCRPFTWTEDPEIVIAKATTPRRRKTQPTPVAEHWAA